MLGRFAAALALVAIFATPASAHTDYPHDWQAKDPEYDGGHDVWRISPPAEAPVLEAGSSQTCKRRLDYFRRLTAWPHTEEFRWTQTVQWCWNDRNKLTYSNFDTSRSAAWWSHWEFQQMAVDIGPQSVDPGRYMYRRTGGEWQWTLPWPIALHFSNILQCSQTVRGDGTSDGGCWR